jgi:alpha,alpha-trehalase
VSRALAAVLVLIACAPPLGAQDALPSPERLAAVRDYIKRAWTTLSRSNADLPRAAPDPKMRLVPGEKWPVYVSAREDLARVEADLRATLPADAWNEIELQRLPAGGRVARHGLLYLPRPYVVPGGRFNEMYGWDSYFILVGLLRDGEVERARDMVDNFVYEIGHYGTILNANRTYYLTRSQPPFLTRMVLGVYERTGDRAWLRATLPAIASYHRFWTTAPHLVPSTGLSRYYDRGAGPAPEVVSDERDAAGRTHYDRVREYYRTHPVPDYDVRLFYDRAADRLTPLFYKGDRSMRESGFDPSNRFGPFSADILHYVPVCLNALLYRMERDAADIHSILGQPDEALAWERRAAARRVAMDRYLWDEEAGLYLDYDFRRGRRRRYEFATTFYPLWAGQASPAQAARVLSSLARFEAPGGLRTSTTVSGSQWDAPFGWAPLQMIAVTGLRNYGHHDAASRLARRFVALVTKEFEEHGVIVEKYDVERRESDVSAGLRFGYSTNEVGFGWTNAAFLDLLAGLESRRGTAALLGRRLPDRPPQPDRAPPDAGEHRPHAVDGGLGGGGERALPARSAGGLPGVRARGAGLRLRGRAAGEAGRPHPQRAHRPPGRQGARTRRVHPERLDAGGGRGLAGGGVQHHLPRRAHRDPLQVPQGQPVDPVRGPRQSA